MALYCKYIAYCRDVNINLALKGDKNAKQYNYV